LRNAGLVHSRKGRGGGYTLALSPSQIMVGQIIRALDGPLAPIACASRNFYRACADCAPDRPCSVQRMMAEVRDAIARILDTRSLASLRALGASGIDELTYSI
jgi:Rrf2 family protein